MASWAGANSRRSQFSTALSRACNARKSSRMISLSLAYSPEDTLVLTIRAISFGSVTLNCCVLCTKISPVPSCLMGLNTIAN
jgi:hypothetical protein